MKYEIPTCEIVFISSADCTVASGDFSLKTEDAPIVDWTVNVTSVDGDDNIPLY